MGIDGLFTILLFLIYSWGLGYSILRFTNFKKDFYEQNILRICFGLSFFIVLSTFLNFIHIPLDWKIFLIISIVFPIYDFIKLKIKKEKINLGSFKKINLTYIFLFLIFFSSLYMYEKGAFAYPWLEDDDSWNHAYGAKYVALEKNAYEPIEGVNTFQYIDAYPPAYDILMGVLHQTSSSLNWTLKFFNSLILSIGILMSFFFFKMFTKSSNKALVATFILACIPAFMSHFIWVHVFIPFLVFLLFYSLENLKEEKAWMIPTIIVFASIFLIQALTQPVKIGGLFAIYFIIIWVVKKKFPKRIFLAGLIGLFLSLLIWWGPMYFKYGSTENLLTTGLTQDTSDIQSDGFSFFKRAGSADRPYTFQDFFVASPINMINNPVGIGSVVMILTIIGLIYLLFNFKSLFSEKKYYLVVTLIWFVYTFLGVQGARLPIQFVAFRFWMLFCIPLAILGSLGFFIILSFVKSFKIPKFLSSSILIMLIIFTSFFAKYQLNTMVWMSPGIDPNDAIVGDGYVKIMEFPLNTKVFELSNFKTRGFGLDMYSCEWCSEVVKLRENYINMTQDEFLNNLKKQDYKYVIISSHFFKHYGEEIANNFLNELLNSENYNIFHQTKSVLILELK